MGDPRFIIAYTLILLTFVMDAGVILILVMHGPLDQNDYALVGGSLGVWHIALAGAYGYWIGSSHSSQSKDETIKKLSDGKTT